MKADSITAHYRISIQWDIPDDIEIERYWIERGIVLVIETKDGRHIEMEAHDDAMDELNCIIPFNVVVEGEVETDSDTESDDE